MYETFYMHYNLTKVLIYTLKMVLSANLSVPALRRFVGYCATTGLRDHIKRDTAT